MHVALVLVVPAFFVLAAWQLDRAEHGNTLSWAYVFEWPFFACYAAWMWWKLVHEEVAERAAAKGGGRAETPAAGGEAPSGLLQEQTPESSAPAGAGAPEETPAEVPLPAGFDPYDESDPELAAYNRYLASLHTDRRAR